LGWDTFWAIFSQSHFRLKNQFYCFSHPPIFKNVAAGLAPGAAVSDDDGVDDHVNDAVPEGQGAHGCQVLKQGAAEKQNAAEHHVRPNKKSAKL
jgi:hypothetical protein